MTADCAMINANLQNQNTQINKIKEQKEIIFFLNRVLWLSDRGIYTLTKQIKKKDRQKYLLTLLRQRLLEKDRNQLLKKERYFKYYEFRHLVMNCTAKKQNVCNVIKKNNTESVFIKKKINKKYKFSTTDNELEN